MSPRFDLHIASGDAPRLDRVRRDAIVTYLLIAPDVALFDTLTRGLVEKRYAIDPILLRQLLSTATQHERAWLASSPASFLLPMRQFAPIWRRVYRRATRWRERERLAIGLESFLRRNPACAAEFVGPIVSWAASPHHDLLLRGVTMLGMLPKLNAANAGRLVRALQGPSDVRMNAMNGIRELLSVPERRTRAVRKVIESEAVHRRIGSLARLDSSRHVRASAQLVLKAWPADWGTIPPAGSGS